MDPPIRYTRTRDGVSIAFWTLGEGPVLVNAALPSSHIKREWETPGLRAIYEWSAKTCRFVRFDHRGVGLSERDVDDFSLDRLVSDLEALVDALEVEQVRMIAFAIGATPALAYAARHPTRVSHLVVVNGSDVGADMAATDALAAVSTLAEQDWVFASEAVTRAFVGWSDEAAARDAAAYLRESIHPRQWFALMQQLQTWDVRAELPRIAAKVLVLQNKELPLRGLPGHRLAATIPHSQFVLLDGLPGPFVDPTGAGIMAQFLSDADGTRPSAEPPRDPRHRTAVILFADIADSTGLTERLGDGAFRERARTLDASLRRVITAHGGEAVEGKLLGDGVLAIFGAARDALQAALECATTGRLSGLALHVGLHAGDVIRERGDVHGGAVNVAARIAAAAPADEVLVSEVVRALARTSAGVSFTDYGAHELKGVSEPQRLFRIAR
jgi:class 3 adenylate cyclase/pimeloyl-ACP methyl ester carboxylesterase